ncbi:hypothetical protein GIY30_19915 [Gordonia sp. HNM0687]|uniref:Uncharacterized protein n=1 Tax=Gordonia mangrovi TaxID=2665643 RepID=A0A6L7GUP1_9ACTN|nr:hypothetical protein [Gordonia mangrovi]MXP23610.1 hypothetical protein [Gordonia mangrovi]UVF79676.1 hypothetical protein NWF22_07535 [Gordonia mangrovi]
MRDLPATLGRDTATTTDDPPRRPLEPGRRVGRHRDDTTIARAELSPEWPDDGPIPSDHPLPERIATLPPERRGRSRKKMAKPLVALGIVTVCAIIGIGAALVVAGVIAFFAGDNADNPDGLSAFIDGAQRSAPAQPAGPATGAADRLDPTQLADARQPAARYVPPPPPQQTYSTPDSTPGGPPAQRRPQDRQATPPPPPAPPPIPVPPPPQQRTIPNPIPGLPPIVIPF